MIFTVPGQTLLSLFLAMVVLGANVPKVVEVIVVVVVVVVVVVIVLVVVAKGEVEEEAAVVASCSSSWGCSKSGPKSLCASPVFFFHRQPVTMLHFLEAVLPWAAFVTAAQLGCTSTASIGSPA